MTDSSDSRRRRRKSGPSRVPPTIDLKATEVETSPAGAAAEPETPATAPGAPDPAVREPGAESTSGRDATAAAVGPLPEETTPSGAEASAPDAAATAPTERATLEGREGGPPDPLFEPGPELHAGAAEGGDRPPGDLRDATAGAPAQPSDADVVQSPRESRRGAGFGAMATSGLLGGLVGAGLLYGLLQTWGGQPETSDQRDQRIERQLGGVARQEDVGALERRLASLEGGQSELGQRVQAAQALAERSAARAEEAASAAPAPAQADPRLDELSRRFEAVEAQLRDGVQAATAATQALERRIAEQDQRLAGAIEPLERRLGEIEQRIAAAVQPLEQRLGQIEQRLATATEPLERRLAEQEQRLTALDRQVEEGGSDMTRASTRVVLADRLGDALRDGAPYAEVLAGLRAFTPDPGKLAPLEPFAESGAPTATALAQSFRPIAERLRRDARQGSEDWSERLLRMADKVVTVRSPNEPAEPGVPTSVAQIEDALARGSFGEAAAAWDSLPEPARQASAEWGQRLKQRAGAEAAARTMAADAVAALNEATR